MEGLDGAQAADTPRLTKEPGSGSDQEPLSIYHQLCWQLLARLPNLFRPHASWAEGLSPHLQAWAFGIWTSCAAEGKPWPSGADHSPPALDRASPGEPEGSSSMV